MTEMEKMLAGRIYDPTDKEICELRTKAHRLCQQYNMLPDTDEKGRSDILHELIPDCNSYANFNFTVLDTCPVYIGDNVFIGPNCTLATPMHPLRYQERNIKHKADGTIYDDEYGRPITIGSNCWLASNVVVIGGVTIGEGCVIGAGSVVTKDIPPHSLAVGNPCRVIRQITEEDTIQYEK